MATERHRTTPSGQCSGLSKLLHGESTGLIRQTAFEVHRYFGRWYLEKVYENALAHRLRKSGLVADQQLPLKVRDEDGTVVGDCFADLLVRGVVLVEIKAAKSLAPEHVAQLLNYLKTSEISVGLLINFGAPRLEVRRFVL
jgi:GxxExxY protein